ncbi:hypothetical protein V1505DRAFT_380553 [Lipomyces doorenjongii]
MATKRGENKLNLAVRAMKQNPNLSIRLAGRIYSVSHATLARRLRPIKSWSFSWLMMWPSLSMVQSSLSRPPLQGYTITWVPASATESLTFNP